MADKSIEARIREHYVAENGEWLVEHGKVKEARLLKEACETIEKLRRSNTTLEKQYYRMLGDTSRKEQTLKRREMVLEEQEKRLRERLESAKEGITYMLENLK